MTLKNKIHDLCEKQKVKERDNKLTLSQYERKNKELKDELREKLKTIHDLRGQLAEKEKLNSDISSTHAACRDILAHYHKLKTDLVSAQVCKESAESLARSAELRVKSLEEQLKKNKELTPHNISSVLQGVYFACKVCKSVCNT